MIEKKRDLSQYNSLSVIDASDLRIGILVSEWNNEITNALKQGAVDTLLKHGVLKNHIYSYSVPGSFELPSAASMLLEAKDEIDAIICLGCIIQGETRHFDFIAQSVANNISHVGCDYNIPVIFGVLTCNTIAQAMERSGGSLGNKGVEAAVSCLKMLNFQKQIYR